MSPKDEYFNVNFDKIQISPKQSQKVKNPFERNSLKKVQQETIHVYRDSLETEHQSNG
jgi:hypothetical protein